MTRVIAIFGKVKKSANGTCGYLQENQKFSIFPANRRTYYSPAIYFSSEKIAVRGEKYSGAVCAYTLKNLTTVHSTTGFAPHTLVFGFDLEIPISVKRSRPNYNFDTYHNELLTQLKETHL